MIEYIVNNETNVSFSPRERLNPSEDVSLTPLNNVLVSTYQDFSKNGISTEGTGLKHTVETGSQDLLQAINRLFGCQKSIQQILSETSRIYVDIFKMDSAFIFEAGHDNNFTKLCSYPDHSATLPAFQPSDKVQVAHEESSPDKSKYFITMPVIHSGTVSYFACLLSGESSFLSPERTAEFQALNHLAGILINNIELEKISESAQMELDALSYSISHDFRSPLQAINNNCDWLNRKFQESNGAEGQKILEQIAASSRHMERLLDGLLEFSRSPQLALKSDLIDMTELVQKVCDDLVKTESDPSSLSIHIGILNHAYGDATLIRQVWYNFISNAFKFTKYRQIREVNIESYQSNGERVYCISDNGAGFDMKYADKLFSAFYRMHGIEEFDGTGIGLAIASRIVKKHGGRVWAESKTDNGADFYFTLPNK